MARHDLLVIGAGPGGYVAAIRAAQLGLDVGCIEKEPALGGTCGRIGCIPSKALLESSELYWQAKQHFAGHGVKVGKLTLDLAAMMERKQTVVNGLTGGVAALFKKNGVARHEGTASFGPDGRVRLVGQGDERVVEAERVLIATGSKVAPLRGVELDGERVATSTEALSWTEVPEHLVVIGAGYIGLELGSVWARLGAAVTVLEYLDRILPGTDAEIAAEAHKLFQRQGMTFALKSRVTSATAVKGGCRVEVEGREPIACDRVLLATGRLPNTDGLGLEHVGIELDPQGRIPVDGHYRTARENVYAIGDVIAGPMLAHKAEEEGIACAEGIATGYGHVNYDAIPGVCYTDPEIATVGRTEEELARQGVPHKKGVFHYRANGRARALGSTDGRVKVLAHAGTDRLLGVHAIGPRAGDLIAEAVAAIEFGASAEDLARTCHAHPTLPEVLKEACLAALGRAIHA
jgi:dihydrolipoamide dehydrogenase